MNDLLLKYKDKNGKSILLDDLLMGDNGVIFVIKKTEVNNCPQYYLLSGDKRLNYGIGACEHMSLIET